MKNEALSPEVIKTAAARIVEYSSARKAEEFDDGCRAGRQWTIEEGEEPEIIEIANQGAKDDPRLTFAVLRDLVKDEEQRDALIAYALNWRDETDESAISDPWAGGFAHGVCQVWEQIEKEVYAQQRQA
ncbi:hypothetical protein RUR49_19040 [Pseudoxanthobacter sp. M-2]|uniref:hypothetical protein n=1 Tax=Pseudoxanthobacter sp. M-2 TaxID=3078754 RepID=UPI0038FC6451